MRRHLFSAAVSAVVLAASFGGTAFAASDEQDLVDKARITLDDVRKDKEFGNTKQLLGRAQAVLIVPALFKGGFFVGGEGGTGVLLTRHASNWSEPAFYTLASASFGLQIGAQESELVLIALTDKAKQAFLKDEFKIGAEAGLSVVTLGAEAEAATTSNLNADIVVWSSSTGAYAGLTLNGSIIKPRTTYNEAYYGSTSGVNEILVKGAAHNAGAEGLRKSLAGLAGI